MEKDVVLRFRISTEEKEFIRKAAEKAGMTISEYGRLSLLSSARATLARGDDREIVAIEFIKTTGEFIVTRVPSSSASPSPSPEGSDDE